MAEGTIIKMQDGSLRIQTNGEWAPYTGVDPAKPKKAGMSKEDRQRLNTMGEDAAAAKEVGSLYDRAEKALADIRPGPYRNSLLLSPAIPEEEGGWADRASAATFGGVARGIGAVTPKETSAYQTARAIQNAAVLERQLLQKGVQTNTDAQRMMLADISPNKDMKANMEIINAGRDQIRRRQAKAAFYTKFANNWGLNGVSPDGFTADELWAKSSDYITKKLMGDGKKPPPTPAPKGPKITVISRTPKAR